MSVVIPSYEQGRFIGETLESVPSQGIESLEVFVADGGSQDETAEVLRRHEGRIRFVSEPDRGQSHALNKAIAATSGEIICWINSDDVYLPGTLRRVQEAFRGDPGVDVLYCRAYHIDEASVPCEEYGTEPFDFDVLTQRCFLCQPATFFTRRICAAAGPIDERLQYTMDYEYWLRIAQMGGRFRHAGFLAAGSRMYPTNKTLGSRLKVHREMALMVARRLGWLPPVWAAHYAHFFLQESGLDPAEHPALLAERCCYMSLGCEQGVSDALWRRVRGMLGP